MSESRVNNLNGVPNFGHGLPEDGVVIAGVTDIPQSLQDLSNNNMSDEKETETNVQEDVANPEEKDVG